MSGDALYGRHARIVVGTDAGNGLDFSDFRCVFEVLRGDFQTPNSCDLRIYNLTNDTATLVSSAEFTQIVIEAGYGTTGQIFKGTIKQARKGREDAKNTYVDLTAADGDEAYQFATISASLASATPGSVASQLVAAMARFGITAGYQPNFPAGGTCRGRVYFGSVRDELRDFANANDCLWSMQDGALTFIPKTSYIPGEIPVISPSTGLIDTPEQTQNGISLRTLLNPAIKVGQLIQLNSTINLYRYPLQPGTTQTVNTAVALQNKVNAEGLYYVMVVKHSGDTRGRSWYSDLTCLAVDATVTDKEQINALFVSPGVAQAIARR